jgi:ketosteroid isomerase-like protein
VSTAEVRRPHRAIGHAMTVSSSSQTDDVRIVENANAASLRASFAAFERQDLEAIRASMSADIVWTMAGSSPLAGVYRGWDEVVGFFIKLSEVTGGELSNQLVSVVADDSYGYALFDSASTIAGEQATHRTIIITEGKDGIAHKIHELALDQASADAHWSRT